MATNIRTPIAAGLVGAESADEKLPVEHIKPIRLPQRDGVESSVMPLEVVERLIPPGHPNRPGLVLAARGVVIHRTGRDVGPDWLGGYFARDPDSVTSTGRYGSSQYGVGDEGIFRYIPEDEQAWQAASIRTNPPYSRNDKDLGVELCQYFDEPPRIRPKTYANAVALAVDLCERHRWEPRGVNPDDAEPYFSRHSDWDKIDRPNDPGEYLRWDDFLDDIEASLLTGRGWQKRKEGTTVERAILELVIKVESLARDIVVWLSRTQRGLDVETGRPFDANVPPIDPRIRAK